MTNFEDEENPFDSKKSPVKHFSLMPDSLLRGDQIAEMRIDLKSGHYFFLEILKTDSLAKIGATFTRFGAMLIKQSNESKDETFEDISTGD